MNNRETGEQEPQELDHEERTEGGTGGDQNEGQGGEEAGGRDLASILSYLIRR